jgi:hypothetical protein
MRHIIFILYLLNLSTRRYYTVAASESALKISAELILGTISGSPISSERGV